MDAGVPALPSRASFDSTSSHSRSVPQLDLQRANGPLHDEITAALARVVESGCFVLGPECQQLEESFAEFCHTKHAVCCASGSDAVLLALMALDLQPGDQVILPSYTFFATASAVTRLGGKPVFVDIDPVTYNLDIEAVEQAITPLTKAILPVHLYGQCAEMDQLRDIATKHNLPLVEDAAQAIGAEWHGRKSGSLGDIGCFSFYPTKNLGALGDGGMLTTNDDALADRLRLLRVHGMRPRYVHSVVGINSRLDAFQAAVLRVKLGHLESWAAQRREVAHHYAALADFYQLRDVVQLPREMLSCVHAWNQYVVRVPAQHRDALRETLAERKVGTEIYYPIPLHLQTCFADLGYREGDLSETERAARETIALPIYPGLTPSEQEYVMRQIADYFAAVRLADPPPVSRPGQAPATYFPETRAA